MSEEILINVTPRETRVALVENGMLQEVHIERANRRGQVGNIYRGRVQRVLPGLQAAFVDIGLERAAFLHVSDIFDKRRKNGGNGNALQDQADASATPATPTISDLLVEGQDITVQVFKDPIGSKGARVTTQLSVPSRYLVLLPDDATIGISTRIEDDEERERLSELVTALRPEERSGWGFIVRTNAENVARPPLAQDVRYLAKLWDSISEAAAGARPGDCIYEDLPLPLRALRDFMGPGVEKVRIDADADFAKTRRFAERFVPDWVDRVEHYPGERPIFDLFGVEDEITRALERTAPLKSGGHIVIDQTEAMTTVDVNTGGYVGHRTLEETVLRTNLEAAQALARQLRLRNLGGIIIIDFIDMESDIHRNQVLVTLEKSLARDHAKAQINGFTSLGLVEMTRKRTTESLGRLLTEDCPTCVGRGAVKSVETVTFEIFREVMRTARLFEPEKVLVLAAPAVTDRIFDEESSAVANLEETTGLTVQFQPEDQYNQEQYDVVML